MDILIFEGIATSGKSTLINKLQDNLQSRRIIVSTENDTHIPIMEQRGELHIQFFIELIDRLVSDKPDLIIFDRLYLTQAYRANVEIAAYRVVEDMLAHYNTTTVFLKVNEANVEERVQKAALHRESEWQEYIQTRGSSTQEIANYYIQQQTTQLKALKNSILLYKIYDTTAHDYDIIAHDIVNDVLAKQPDNLDT